MATRGARVVFQVGLTTSRAAARTRPAGALNRSISVDTRRAGDAVRTLLASNSGYRYRHGMDTPGSHAVDPVERAISISGSEAYLNHPQGATRDPSPAIVMSEDPRYHSAFPATDGDRPQSPRGLLNLDWLVGSVHKLAPVRRGPMVVPGEAQVRPITGAATKMNAPPSMWGSMSRRHFSTGAQGVHVQRPADASHATHHAALEDPFTANEADVAKAGTSNYRKPLPADHMYTNIDVDTGVSADQSSLSTHAGPNQSAETPKDVRDSEGPGEFLRASAQRGTIRRDPFDIDSTEAVAEARNEDEFFPDAGHLELKTADYLGAGPHRYSSTTQSPEASVAPPSGYQRGVMSSGPTPGFYPDTMILEPDVKQAIPARGLPEHHITVEPEQLAENLHETAGFFPDTNVTDPLEVADMPPPASGVRKDARGAPIRKM